MFSGGEKKSFYELSIFIGIGVIALELKSTDSCVYNNAIFCRLCFFYVKSPQEFNFFLLYRYFINLSQIIRS